MDKLIEYPKLIKRILTEYIELCNNRIRSINRGKSLTDEPQTSQNRSQHGSLPRFIERIPIIALPNKTSRHS